MSDVIAMEEAYEVGSYKRFPFVLKEGKGSYVTCEDGRRLLDLYGGHAVVGLGHCNQQVNDAIKSQMDHLVFYSNLVYSRVRAEAARALCDFAPAGQGWKSFFVNSGAEANENAIKVARMQTGRKGVIAFEGGFHGRTAAAIAATGIASVREACQPVMPGFFHVPFGDLDQVERELNTGDIAAIILEPIQSMAGICEMEAGFYSGLRQLCDRHRAFLIYDEVQTGIGRTGRPFYAGRHGVMPDIITLGKSIANGIPMGACLFRGHVADKIAIGDLGTTFGGAPIACVALAATLNQLTDDLLDHVNKLFERIKAGLAQNKLVERVRGRGMLLGIEFKDLDAKVVQTQLLERGIITGLSGHNRVMRLLPPLNLTFDQADEFLNAMAELEGMQ